MSVITVVRKNGFVAIAADTMSKNGTTRETATYIINHDKIWQVGDSFAVISGPTSAKLALQHYFATLPEAPALTDVKAIYSAWLAVHQALQDNYFLDVSQDTEGAFESAQMDVLIANSKGIFGVSAHRSVQEFSKFYASGRGDEYAMGAMYATYAEESKSAEAIARLGVEAAAEFCDSVGLPVTSRAIKLDAAN